MLTSLVDPCDRCPKCGAPAKMQEIVSRCIDPDRAGVGSGPELGSRYNAYLQIPQAPTPDRQHRYLFGLCAHSVAEGWRCTLKDVWTSLYIGAYPVIELGTADATRCLVDSEVTDPKFAFPDGNTLWYVIWRPGVRFNDAQFDPAPQAGMYPGLQFQGSSLLYLPGFGRYTPPNAGQPGGVAVGSLDGFTLLRTPPTASPLDFTWQIDGPGTLYVLCSVRQTDPATRRIWTPADGADLGAFSSEKRFIWQMNKNTVMADGPDCFPRYTSLAAGMVVGSRVLCCQGPQPGPFWGRNAPGHERHGELLPPLLPPPGQEQPS